MEKQNFRVPCLRDPVGTECKSGCNNYQKAVIQVRKAAQMAGITPLAYSKKIVGESGPYLKKESEKILPIAIMLNCNKP